MTELLSWENILNGYRAGGNFRNGDKQTSDRRNEFENDFDRITFSSSLRRLQDKAQVFPLEKKDFVRSRLTHSLEVSTLARSLGLSVGRHLEDNIDNFSTEDTSKMSAILASAGLIHDIGNPPFGHFGETAIRDWFKDYFEYNKEKNITQLNNREHFIKVDNVEYHSSLNEQQIYDFINFEGNAQALRILTRLHFFIDDKGMNLTYGLLNSIIKYPRKSTEIKKEEGISYKKMGYFTAEMEIFNEIVEKTGLSDKRNPLVFLLEAADDIAYKVADIEDGLKKGVISYDIIHKEVSDIVNRDILKEYNQVRMLENNPEVQEQKIKNLLKRDGNLLYLHKLENYYQNAVNYDYDDSSTYAIQRFRVNVQGTMMNAVTKAFVNHYEEIMTGNLEKDLLEIGDAYKISKALQNIATQYIFKDNNVIKLEVMGHRVIWGLLDIFVPAVLSPNYNDGSTREGKIYQLISLNYRFVNEKFGTGIWGKNANFLYNRLLLVTDFICSMTDSYALELYQELTGIKL